MDPVEPWIDVDAVRRLARQLVEPPGFEAPVPEPDAGFGPVFEGFINAAPPPLPPAVERQEVAPAVSPIETPAPPEAPPERPVPAETSTEASAPAEISAPRDRPSEEPSGKPFFPTPTAREASPPVGREVAHAAPEPLLDRLARFREWLIQQLDARGAFVLERDGEPVLDDPAFGKLHFLARSLAQAYRPVKGEVGNVHVKVGAEAYLAVVPVDTAFGRLVLGTVLPEPLDAASVEVVADTLKRAASPPRR